MTSRTLILIAAWNEEASIGAVILGVHKLYPHLPIVVVDDCSADSTATTAAKAGADVIQLPIHLGLGGALQTGYKFAFEQGFDQVVRIDGDGQHDPADIARMIATLEQTGCEVVIGSRYRGKSKSYTTFTRGLGIIFLRALLKPILGRTITDPTSGFTAVNRRALEVFARTFPLAYPEIEVLVVLQRKRFRFEEIPVKIIPRREGRSSITAWKSVQYMLYVIIGVFVNVVRINPLAQKPENGEKG